VSWGLQVLQQAMMLTDQQSEPHNEEASRVLKFFMSTLLNGSMKAPQPLHQMRSLTTRTFLPLQRNPLPLFLPSTELIYYLAILQS
jgi:hypothetical protein